jgi:hypothetical protein
MNLVRLFFLALSALLSSCSVMPRSSDVSAVLAGIKDMHLSGFRGHWTPGMLASAKGSNGGFFLDYDQRHADGDGTAPLVEGGNVRWRIHGLEVIDPRRSGRGLFHRMIVLQGEFVVHGGTMSGTYRRALVHVTHFESAPPWMCVHVIRDDWDLSSQAQEARNASPAGTLYFHVTDAR